MNMSTTHTIHVSNKMTKYLCFQVSEILMYVFKSATLTTQKLLMGSIHLLKANLLTPVK